MSTDARGYVNARDQRDTYRRMVEDLRERDELRERLDQAQEALGRWEAEHELEYKRLFWLGEQGELNALDAEWNELVRDRDLARDALAEWSL